MQFVTTDPTLADGRSHVPAAPHYAASLDGSAVWTCAPRSLCVYAVRFNRNDLRHYVNGVPFDTLHAALAWVATR